MSTNRTRILAGLIVATGLGLGGAALAGAQEAETDDPTTTTEAPATDDSVTEEAPATEDPAAPADGEDCPHDGEGRGPRGADAPTEDTATTAT